MAALDFESLPRMAQNLVLANQTSSWSIDVGAGFINMAAATGGVILPHNLGVTPTFIIPSVLHQTVDYTIRCSVFNATTLTLNLRSVTGAIGGLTAVQFIAISMDADP